MEHAVKKIDMHYPRGRGPSMDMARARLRKSKIPPFFLIFSMQTDLVYYYTTTCTLLIWKNLDSLKCSSSFLTCSKDFYVCKGYSIAVEANVIITSLLCLFMCNCLVSLLRQDVYHKLDQSD